MGKDVCQIDIYVELWKKVKGRLGLCLKQLGGVG